MQQERKSMDHDHDRHNLSTQQQLQQELSHILSSTLNRRLSLQDKA